MIICAANFAMGWMSKLLATASKRNHLLLKESGVSNVLDYDVPSNKVHISAAVDDKAIKCILDCIGS